MHGLHRPAAVHDLQRPAAVHAHRAVLQSSASGGGCVHMQVACGAGYTMFLVDPEAPQVRPKAQRSVWGCARGRPAPGWLFHAPTARGLYSGGQPARTASARRPATRPAEPLHALPAPRSQQCCMGQGYMNQDSCVIRVRIKSGGGRGGLGLGKG